MTLEQVKSDLADYPLYMSAADVKKFAGFRDVDTAYRLMKTKKGKHATRDFPLQPITPGWKGVRVHKEDFAVWWAECRK